MSISQVWKECFAKWPSDLGRNGVAVTNFNEQIVFCNFLLGDTMVLLERRAPDTIGARTVLLPFEHILGLKILDVAKTKSFQDWGFKGKLTLG